MIARPARHWMRGRPAKRAFRSAGLCSLCMLFVALATPSWAWLGRHEEEERPKLPVMDVDLVELEVPANAAPVSFQMSKLYIPIIPEVATFLNQSDLEWSYRDENPLTGRPRFHVYVLGQPFRIKNKTVQGIHTVIELPDQVSTASCKVAAINAEAELGSEQHIGPFRAVLLVCQVHPSPSESLQNSRILLPQGHPMRWLLLPWLLLLLPFIVGSSLGPFALLGGAALTLASIACLSFLIAVLIVIVQRRCIHCTRRWRRLWRLRMLQRRQKQIATAFGDSGPCCICLGESDSRDSLIALLPCRHALHAECYASWVSADAPRVRDHS